MDYTTATLLSSSTSTPAVKVILNNFNTDDDLTWSWRSQECLDPMRTLLLEAAHTLVGWPSCMAQLCSRWGEFHMQKNHCIEVLQVSLGTERND